MNNTYAIHNEKKRQRQSKVANHTNTGRNLTKLHVDRAVHKLFLNIWATLVILPLIYTTRFEILHTTLTIRIGKTSFTMIVYSNLDEMMAAH